jgi:hypothetical protein
MKPVSLNSHTPLPLSVYTPTWLASAVLSFNMRFLNFAALFALPFLIGAAPVEDAKPTKGYQMGIFYVNWVMNPTEFFQITC